MHFKSNSFLAFACAIFLSITAKDWGKVSLVKLNKNILLRKVYAVYAGISHEVCLFAFTGVFFDDRWWGGRERERCNSSPLLSDSYAQLLMMKHH